MGVRNLIRKSGLSQKAVYAIITGKPVRKAKKNRARQSSNTVLAASCWPTIVISHNVMY
jgi:hypothetical protein